MTEQLPQERDPRNGENLRPGCIRIGDEALRRAIEFVRMEQVVAEYIRDDEALSAWQDEEKRLEAGMYGRGLRAITY